jgi:hypothetical protein
MRKPIGQAPRRVSTKGSPSAQGQSTNTATPQPLANSAPRTQEIGGPLPSDPDCGRVQSLLLGPGETVEFSVFVRGLGFLEGEIWSPERGLPAALRNVGFRLVEYCRAPQAQRQAMLPMIQAELQRIEQQASMGEPAAAREPPSTGSVWSAGDNMNPDLQTGAPADGGGWCPRATRACGCR